MLVPPPEPPALPGRARFAPIVAFRLALGLALLAAPVPALAQSEPHIGPGDVLQLRSIRQPELGGEYPVQAGGEIALPLLGRVSVAGQTSGAAEAAVVAALRESGIATAPDVALAVLRHRDVFVSGAVARPGAYPWRPGLTVRQALALAGGRRLVPDDEIGAEVQAIRAEEYHVALVRRIAALDINRARLDAQIAAVRAGAAEAEGVPVTVAWPDIPASVDARALRTAQEALLQASLARDRATHASLRARHGALTARIEALERRLERLDESEMLLTERLQTLEGLGAAGLAPRPQILEIRQSMVQLASTELEVIADLAEARGALAEIELALDSFAHERITLLQTELSAIRAELLEARSRVDFARRAAYVTAGYAPATTLEAPEILAVVREDPHGPNPLPITVDDALWPGDTLIVPPMPDAGADPLAVDPTSAMPAALPGGDVYRQGNAP